MKHSILLIILSFVTLTAYSQRANPEINFQKTEHNFGTIIEGEVKKVDFTFTNTGTAPLVITKVENSCGCTTPHYSKKPVMPGETGVITTSFNSRDWPGTFSRTVTVHTNQRGRNGRVVLTVSGVVVDKK